MGTYKLAPGYEPGGYGKKRVGLKATGNELPDYLAAVFLESGIIEREDEPKPKRATKKKKEQD